MRTLRNGIDAINLSKTSNMWPTMYTTLWHSLCLLHTQPRCVVWATQPKKKNQFEPVRAHLFYGTYAVFTHHNGTTVSVDGLLSNTLGILSFIRILIFIPVCSFGFFFLFFFLVLSLHAAWSMSVWFNFFSPFSFVHTIDDSNICDGDGRMWCERGRTSVSSHKAKMWICYLMLQNL